MRNPHKILISLTLLFLVLTTCAQATKKAPSNSEYIKGELVIMVKEEYRNANIQEMVRTISNNIWGMESAYTEGFPIKENSDFLRTYLLHFPINTDIKEESRKFNAARFIEIAEPNYPIKLASTPNDDFYWDQWGLHKIEADKAFNIEMGNENVTIAILDNGIDPNHEDLVDKIAPGGYDFGDDDGDFEDYGAGIFPGHGTKTAGIAAASTNNVLGIAGSCANCKVLPLKVFQDNGAGSTYYLWRALTYIKDNGNANIISMSLTYENPSTQIETVINELKEQRRYSVACAGNEGNDIPLYPAAHRNVIGVAATYENDERKSDSNYGPWVSVAAPGNIILTTTLNNGYIHDSGTSFATPFVSGLVGLMISKNPNLSFEEVNQTITNTSDPTTGFDPPIGRINAYQALLTLNRAPTIFQIEDIHTIETATVTIIARATDPDDDLLNFSINDARFDKTPLPPFENIQSTKFNWSTGYSDQGNYSFSITVSNGYLNDSTIVNVEVKNRDFPGSGSPVMIKPILPYQMAFLDGEENQY